MYKPKVILVVMDGWGYSPVHEGNAIWSAKTPNFDYLLDHYDHILLNSFGENVGLPWGSIGSSEVGHAAIGAGKLLFQELSLIDKEINTGEFFKNKIITEFVEKAEKSEGDIHLIGLVSNGGVHSHLEHLFGILDFLKVKKFKKNVYIHIITDGRDTGPKEALEFVGAVRKAMSKSGLKVSIATVSGRYYTMDRDNRWERTKQAYLTITEESGKKYSSPEEAIQANYDKNVTDEFIVPSVINKTANSLGFFDKLFGKKPGDQDNKTSKVKPGDSIIFFNTRPDRMRQITEMFLFPRKEEKTTPIKNLNILTLSTYSEYLPVTVAYPTVKVENPIAKILSDHKIKQGHFAETEKFAHVTYFFNGANSKKYPGETWDVVPSPKVETYDQKPEMSANEITDHVMEITEKEKLDFVLINYANADMVGHTGNFNAVVKAVETVDSQLKRLLEFTPESTIIVTADHGNAECMIHPETGEIDKHHTVNPVPMIIVNPSFTRKKDEAENLKPAGILADIAPTVLSFFDIEKPKDMNGVNIIPNFVHRKEEKEEKN